MESSKAGSEGSSALLQAVLRLTEVSVFLSEFQGKSRKRGYFLQESEFRQQFRGLSEALSTRRGETVATLSTIVSRMREQLKLKKEMEPLLEKAQGKEIERESDRLRPRFCM